jgi:hypothetical protein
MGKASLRRHRPDRSTSGVARSGAQRLLDHSSNLIVVDVSWPAGTSLVEQRRRDDPSRPPPLLADHVLVQAELDRNCLASRSVRTSYDYAAPLGAEDGLRRDPGALSTRTS